MTKGEKQRASEDKSTREGTKALNQALRKNLVAEIRSHVDSVLEGSEDIELWWFHDFLLTADSWCLFEAFRCSLGADGTRALWESFKDGLPHFEPGDDDPFSGKRAMNVIYSDAAAEDTSWIHSTPDGGDSFEFQLASVDYAGGEAVQILNVTRGEYRKLKYYLAELRGLRTGKLGAA